MSQKSKNGVSINFAGLLTIAFIVLKLTKVISWSWFWVLLPITFPLWIVLVIAGAGLLFAFIVWLFTLGKK